MRANTDAFLTVLRQGHPVTPIVVCSPVLRPDAETTPNRLGATLVDLRGAIESVASQHDVTLVSGNGLLTADQLADGIHPGDDGHRVMADVFGAAVARAAGPGTQLSTAGPG
jgi:lysophospholipase L1-like esterase